MKSGKVVVEKLMSLRHVYYRQTFSSIKKKKQ